MSSARLRRPERRKFHAKKGEPHALALSACKMISKILLICLALFSFTYCSPQFRKESGESLENISTYSGPPLLNENLAAGLNKRTPFGSGLSSFEEFRNDDSRESVKTSASHNRPPYAPEDNYPLLHLRNQIPVSQPRPQQKPQQYLKETPKSRPKPQFKRPLDPKALEEEEEQQPDRLTELLPQSNFDCVSKNTGYYADESLGCEVFHYCQENARHSWICPEGFTFHQVHLICMPPSKDNICKQSSKFHFVNDYLYKPVNLEEHQNRNATLRYHERYYPEEYHQYPEVDYEDNINQRRQPVKQHQTQVVRRPTHIPFQATIRPEPNIGQVYRSPEDINIPLEHRRPQQYLPQRYLIPE